MQNRVSEEISLDPKTNKSGNVWHVFLKGDFDNMLYGYKFDGKLSPEKGHYYDYSRIVLDPYAKVSDVNKLSLILFVIAVVLSNERRMLIPYAWIDDFFHEFF